MFPNWFDDSEGAEEYSRNNPNSKHYDPGYHGDDSGIEDDYEGDSQYDKENDAEYDDPDFGDFGGDQVDGDFYEDEEYDPPDIFDEDFDPDDYDEDW